MGKLTKAIVVKNGTEEVEVRYSDGIDKGNIYRLLWDLFLPDYGAAPPDKIDINMYEVNIPDVDNLQPPSVEIANLANIREIN